MNHLQSGPKVSGRALISLGTVFLARAFTATTITIHVLSESTRILIILPNYGAQNKCKSHPTILGWIAIRPNRGLTLRNNRISQRGDANCIRVETELFSMVIVQLLCIFTE